MSPFSQRAHLQVVWSRTSPAAQGGSGQQLTSWSDARRHGIWPWKQHRWPVAKGQNSRSVLQHVWSPQHSDRAAQQRTLPSVWSQTVASFAQHLAIFGLGQNSWL